MPDCTSAFIVIGGPIPRALIPSLCRVITAQGVSLDSDQLAVFENQSDLESALNLEGHLQFTDSEALGGAFEQLETFLERHGISYNRHSSARCEYDAELVRYRSDPNGGCKLVQLAIESGAPVVPIAEIEKVRHLLLSGNVAATVALLDRLCETLPELDPIRFTDDVTA